MKKPKMNKMVEICMRNKAFRENYQNMPQDPNTVSVSYVGSKSNSL